jgi:hypothetical protein
MDKHIQSYEFEEECTSCGIEIVEKERYGKEFYPIKKGKLAYKTVYYCGNCEDYVDTDHEYCPHCRVPLDWDLLDDDIDC